jgi:hypothetical protein
MQERRSVKKIVLRWLTGTVMPSSMWQKGLLIPVDCLGKTWKRKLMSKPVEKGSAVSGMVVGALMILLSIGQVLPYLRLSLLSKADETAAAAAAAGGVGSWAMWDEKNVTLVASVLRTTDVLLKEIEHLHSFIKVQVEPKVAPGLRAAPLVVLRGIAVATDHPKRPSIITDSLEVEAKGMAQRNQMLCDLLVILETDNVELSTSAGIVLTSALAKSTEQVFHARWQVGELGCIRWWTVVAKIQPVNHLERET